MHTERINIFFSKKNINLNVIQYNSVFIKVSLLPETQISANHLSILIIPLIITDSAPAPIMVDFHSSLKPLLSTHQTKRSPNTCSSGKGEKTRKKKNQKDKKKKKEP